MGERWAMRSNRDNTNINNQKKDDDGEEDEDEMAAKNKLRHSQAETLFRLGKENGSHG